MMTVFHGIFIGYILGALVTMICIWLAGGSLYAEPDESEEDEKAPDDAATSKPRHTK